MSDGTVIAGLARYTVANSSSASFPALTPAASPSGALIGPKNTASFITIVPFGTGTANTTFSFRVIAIEQSPQKDTTFFRPLAEFACTLGTQTGATGLLVEATEKFVDTIAQTYGATSCRVVSPEDNTSAYVVMDMEGAERIRIDFDMTGATDGNVLYKLI